MRVLLDECVPRKLGRELTGHDVLTVKQAGLVGIQNGELLRRAATDFDVFVTVDANLEYQQNTSSLPVPVVVLIAHTNAIHVLRLLAPQLRALLPSVQRGRLYHVGPPGPIR